MKSAYELAMERLNRISPTVTPTPEQKKRLAELDSEYAAKIAEREISIQAEIQKCAGDVLRVEELQRQLVNERKALQEKLEEKKEAVRQGKA
ncbi:MAG TPA: hypothetical protein GYA07_02720 [Verrucomicrobia bacterium]|nr:hypothetical protein [Verrucomicrobiota bacterium]HOB32253.1 hypothetical protein [Verrucomicrobiota bacterium]HOP97300.1 hypothetical protein [Verrucomicrobiota bacterium]HPU55905.1 hypothetical protein [Verrucomicrobiota bacterium]